ncbi:MAG: Maf family protein, partial [Gemmatimonadales bacterium]
MTNVLTLASQSPRRKQLLEMLGLPILVQPSDVYEKPLPKEAPLAYARRLAREKAQAGTGQFVLGADTIVVLDDHLLEKPVDDADALRMLRLLEGRSHEVITSIALVANGTLYQDTDITRVTFRSADDAFLTAYI